MATLCIRQFTNIVITILVNQSKKSNVIMPPSGTFTVDFTYLYKVKFFDIYKLFVKLTVTVKSYI